MAIFISRLWTQPILITAMLASLVNITGCAKKAEQQEAKPQETTRNHNIKYRLSEVWYFADC